MKINLVILFFCAFVSVSSADSLDEILDVRLAKAQLAYSNKNTGAANAYLRKNLLSKRFHMKTYLFLADSFRNLAAYSKAMKVYYVAIKRLHGKHLLEAGDQEALDYALEKFPRPNWSAISLYFKVGETYFEMARKTGSKKYQKKLYALTLKYFQICTYYKFEVERSNHYVGQAHQQFGQKEDAIVSFMESKKALNRHFSKGKGNDLLLGDTLATRGEYDSANMYLRSVYLSPLSSTALKRYAEEYLNHLYERYFVFVGSYDFGLKSNIARLTNLAKKDRETVNDGPFSELAISGLFSEGFAKYWKAVVSGDYSNLNYMDDMLTSDERRTFDWQFTLQYDNILKSLLKLSYKENIQYAKNRENRKYHKLAKNKKVKAAYYHAFSSGTASIFLSYGKQKYLMLSPDYLTQLYGLGLSYVPYYTNKYFAPSYAIEFEKESNESGTGEGLLTKLSFANHFDYSEAVSSFLFYDYSIYSTDNDDTSYHSAKLVYYITYATKIKRLALHGKITNIVSNYDSWSYGSPDYQIVEWIGQVGLSFTL